MDRHLGCQLLQLLCKAFARIALFLQAAGPDAHMSVKAHQRADPTRDDVRVRAHRFKGFIGNFKPSPRMIYYHLLKC